MDKKSRRPGTKSGAAAFYMERHFMDALCGNRDVVALVFDLLLLFFLGKM